MENDKQTMSNHYNCVEEVGVPEQESETPTGRLTMLSLNPRYTKTHKSKGKKSV